MRSHRRLLIDRPPTRAAAPQELRDEFDIDMRVLGIISSERMLLSETAIDLGHWRERFDRCAHSCVKSSCCCILLLYLHLLCQAGDFVLLRPFVVPASAERGRCRHPARAMLAMVVIVIKRDESSRTRRSAGAEAWPRAPTQGCAAGGHGRVCGAPGGQLCAQHGHRGCDRLLAPARALHGLDAGAAPHWQGCIDSWC